MSDQRQTINTLEKLTQLLSQKQITERQGVAIHRHPRRIAFAYAVTGCFTSLLAIKWPIITLITVTAMVWSGLQDLQMKRGWVSRLSVRSCGENLIVWNQCRMFNAEADLSPEIVIAMPWNLKPNPPQKGLTALCFICALLPLGPLAIQQPSVQIAIPLFLSATALLMYQKTSDTLPPLHPYVLKSIQTIGEALRSVKHAIVLFDGGSDSAGLDTFVQNYQHILSPAHASLVLFEPDSQISVSYSNSDSLKNEHQCQPLPKWSWGAPLAKVGWTVTHIKGDYEPRILKDCLDARSQIQSLPDETPTP